MLPQERRALLLREHGFPENYLDSVYTCPDCRDTGWIGGKHCHCLEKEIISLFYTQSGLSGILQKENFDTFDLSYYRKDLMDEKTGKSSYEIMSGALGTCRTFAQQFQRGAEKNSLLLTGAAGRGKTFLTHCIAKELIDKGHSVIYYSAGELFDLIAKNRFGRGQDEDDQMPDDQYLSGCDLLIIDDLGTEIVNSFVASQLFRLLNERILNHKSTLISTNLSLAQLSALYSERIMSRITSSFTLLAFFGNDIRLLKKLKK